MTISWVTAATIFISGVNIGMLLSSAIGRWVKR